MATIVHAADWLAGSHRKTTGRVLFVVAVILATIAMWGASFSDLISQLPL